MRLRQISGLVTMVTLLVVRGEHLELMSTHSRELRMMGDFILQESSHDAEGEQLV